jgi:GR25 family glycosyltransferase involved in LPS biosynthesis
MMVNNPSYRNYKWALKFPFDEFEGDPCWDPIDVIYVINDPERQDRLYDTLKEFKKMGIPLSKVKIQPAQFDDSTGNPYANRLIGCFKSHAKVFEALLQSNYQNMLVFEDDFTFSDPMEENKKQLIQFFERKYEYDVLLLSTSAVGKIKPKDDLISYSLQECTTSSGYILSRKGLEKVYPIWVDGIKGLLSNCDYNYYACDRYWTQIQKDNKMLTFNRKIGYQRPAYSTTLKTMTYYLD